MAIRFTCPSCQQPIEIDEGWGGTSVGCPYCKKVVAAPRSSTWPPGEVPQASPAGAAFEPPPPPPGRPVRQGEAPRRRGNSAAWALMLAVMCAVLSVLAYMVWFGQVAQLAAAKTGPDPSDAEVREALTEVLREATASGRFPTNRFSTSAAIVGTLCGLGGLLLGIRSAVRREERRGMAIAACIVGACFLPCQMPMIMMGYQPDLPATVEPASSQPATSQPASSPPASGQPTSRPSAPGEGGQADEQSAATLAAPPVLPSDDPCPPPRADDGPAWRAPLRVAAKRLAHRRCSPPLL